MTWTMSSDDVNMFMEEVTCFISKPIGNIIPTVTVKVFLNQKPWVAKTNHEAPKARTTGYNEGLSFGDISLYNPASYRYKLKQAVKAEKRQCRDKVEAQLCDCNVCGKDFRRAQTIEDECTPRLTWKI